MCRNALFVGESTLGRFLFFLCSFSVDIQVKVDDLVTQREI